MLPYGREAQTMTPFIFPVTDSYIIVTQSFRKCEYISLSMCVFKIEIGHNFGEQSLDLYYLDSGFTLLN